MCFVVWHRTLEQVEHGTQTLKHSNTKITHSKKYIEKSILAGAISEEIFQVKPGVKNLWPGNIKGVCSWWGA